MTTQTDEHPWLVRFCDAFFQERNIKWLLGMGILILLGSSTMLVCSHWQDATPLWKLSILFGYTFAAHLAGQFSYHRLALRRTGTGLMALTVLLIPLDFLALRWVHPAGLEQVALLGLLGLFAVLSVFAARRVFHHFLRRTQWIFLGSYLTLAFSGALLPLVPVALVPLTTALLWGVFSLGVWDANRHVFWLTEEHRLPRIFGFFPLLLLGGQFLLLFSLGLFPFIPLQWLGLGLTLSAVPILLSTEALARAVAHCHPEERRLPVSVAAPLLMGLGTMLAGVGLAASGFPQTSTLVPTALVAAGLSAVIARRTQHSAFTWLMLLFVMTAYQTSPVFFKELARTVVQSGAAAIHEQRLPYAFYGLTYMPLLAVISALTAWKPVRETPHFAKPMKQFALGLPVLLLIVSLSHVKATFPVGLALSGLFGLQLRLFSDRRLLPVSLAAFLVAIFGITSFLHDVMLIPINREWPLLIWLTAGALLTFAGRYVDRITLPYARSDSAWAMAPYCQLAGLGLVLLSAGCWLSMAFRDVPPLLAGGVTLTLLFVHAVRWRHDLVSACALTFPILSSTIIAAHAGWDVSSVITLVVVELAVVSWISRWGMALFARSGRGVAQVGLSLVLLLLLPWLLATSFGLTHFPAWSAAGLALATVIELAWRRQSRWLTMLGWVTTLTLAGAAWATAHLLPHPADWLPCLWATISSIPVVWFAIRRDAFKRSDSRPLVFATLERCAGITLLSIALITLPVFTAPFRIAAVIALAGLFGLTWNLPTRTFVQGTLILLNLHILAMVVQVTLPDVTHFYALTWQTFSAAGWPLALVAAGSALFWDSRRRSMPESGRAMSLLMQFVCLVSLYARATWPPLAVTGWDILLITGAFLGLTVVHVRQTLSACRITDQPSSAERHLWFAESLIGLGAVYLVYFEVISLESGFGMFAVLLAAIVAAGLGHFASQSDRYRAISRPLQRTGDVLPLVTVALGVTRHLTVDHPTWLGLNSLALLLVASFYFWQGLERRESLRLLLSAIILNIALCLLWNELRWSDPQLFLIPVGLSVLGFSELLRTKIPASFHDPLRYIGALTILVSPTFHIVDGSWLHLLTLMVLSIGIVLLAMGLRIRALMYAGTAFLIADVIAMVVRGSLDHPGGLWLAGIAMGAGIIALAAYCERHRELMLQRLRFVAAQLETWN